MIFTKRQPWLRLQNRQTYIRILVYFVVVSIGVMTVTMLILYGLFSRVTLQEIGKHSESQITQRAESTSFLLEKTFSTALNYSQNNDILRFALEDEDDAIINYQAWRLLKEIKTNNPILESLYIINGHTRQVASTATGISPTDDFYDQEIIETIHNWNHPFFFKLTSRSLQGESEDVHIFSIIIPYELDKSISAFVVNIDLQKLQYFFEQNLDKAAGEILLVDEKNQIISSSSRYSFLTAIPTDILEQTSRTQGGRLNYENGDEHSLIAYADLSFAGWKLIQIIPSDLIFSNVRNMKNLAVLIYIVIFFVVLYCVWKLSRKIYSPIEELIGDVRKNFNKHIDDGDQKDSSELSILSKALKWQTSQIDRLSKKWNNNRSSIKKSFLKEFLKGELSSTRPINDVIEEYDLKILPEKFVVIIFRIDQFQRFMQINNVFQQRLLRYAMTNIAQEMIDKQYSLETVDMGNDHIVIVSNINEENEYSRLEGLLKQCQEKITQYLSISTTTAFSSLTERFSDLPDAYLRAYELTQERFRLGLGQIISDGKVADLEPTVYSYPEDKERQILSELKLGHAKEAALHVDEFIEIGKKYPCSELTLALNQLMISIGKTLRQLRTHSDKLPSYHLTYIQEQINTLETVDRTQHWIKSILDDAVQLMNQQKESKNATVAKEIVKLVEVHIEDPNLSAKFIADCLNLSVNYARTIFKEEINESLAEHIKEKRLQIAQDLLMQTDLSVEDICLRAGFPAVNSFYSIFKKKTGMTPVQFRREPRRIEADE